VHLAYSRQYAQGAGPVTGGLTDFVPPKPDLFYLDHDQRDTLTAGFETELPWKSWVAGNLASGSGFLDGDGPAHLPSHTALDLSFGKSFGEAFSIRVTALNVTNGRYLLDSSSSFGGTHYNFPRQIAVTLRYRFHY
jgi:outer membrane receptor protein involved in Fe transport